MGLAFRSAAGVSHTCTATAFEHQTFHHRIRFDGEVRSFPRRVEIALRRTHALAAADRGLRHGDAVLIEAVVVVRSLDPDGFGGGEEAVIEATALVAVGDLQRPPTTPNLVGTAGVAFHAPEDREHVLIAPATVAELCPMIVVLPLPADPYHPVDGARAAEHAPAWDGDCSPSRIVLGFRGVQPIHAGAIDEAREADRYLRQPMRLASCFQQQNAKTAVLREAAGERRARRSGANDDEIDSALVHGSKSSDPFHRDLSQRHHRGRRLSRGELPIADMGLCSNMIGRWWATSA